MPRGEREVANHLADARVSEARVRGREKGGVGHLRIGRKPEPAQQLLAVVDARLAHEHAVIVRKRLPVERVLGYELRRQRRRPGAPIRIAPQPGLSRAAAESAGHALERPLYLRCAGSREKEEHRQSAGAVKSWTILSCR